MNLTFSDRPWSCLRRLGLLVLLATVPACGLSEYEERMSETQERVDRFHDERKYLDEPVQIPKEKDKDGKEQSLANVFFQPPKGIDAKPYPYTDLLWEYKPRKGDSSNFTSMQMAFAPNDKDFVSKVENIHPRTQTRPPQRTPPLPFDSWEFDNGGRVYSVNISKSGTTKVAIIYIFPKKQREQASKAIELSLRSLAVDHETTGARQKYERKSPWQLKKNEDDD